MLAHEIELARFDNFAPRPLGPSGRVRLELATADHDIVCHSLIYRDGLCVDWVLDDREGPWALRLPVPTRHHFITTPDITELTNTDRFALRVGTRVVPLPPFDEFETGIWTLPQQPNRVDGFEVDTDLDVVMVMSGTPIGDFSFTFPFREGHGIDPRTQAELSPTENIIEMRFDWATRALGPRQLQSHLDWLDRGAFVGGSWMALRLCEGYTLAARANMKPTTLVPLPEPLRWWCQPEASLFATA